LCIYPEETAADAEWDAKKAAANLQKHGVDFADERLFSMTSKLLRFATMKAATGGTSRSAWTLWVTCLSSSTLGAAIGHA
jgi:hypothetical protein